MYNVQREIASSYFRKLVPLGQVFKKVAWAKTIEKGEDFLTRRFAHSSERALMYKVFMKWYRQRWMVLHFSQVQWNLCWQRRIYSNNLLRAIEFFYHLLLLGLAQIIVVRKRRNLHQLQELSIQNEKSESGNPANAFHFADARINMIFPWSSRPVDEWCRYDPRNSA